MFVDTELVIKSIGIRIKRSGKSSKINDKDWNHIFTIDKIDYPFTQFNLAKFPKLNREVQNG